MGYNFKTLTMSMHNPSSRRPGTFLPLIFCHHSTVYSKNKGSFLSRQKCPPNPCSWVTHSGVKVPVHLHLSRSAVSRATLLLSSFNPVIFLCSSYFYNVVVWCCVYRLMETLLPLRSPLAMALSRFMSQVFDDQTALYSNTDHCGILQSSAGPFAACHQRLPPQTFVKSCLYYLVLSVCRRRIPVNYVSSPKCLHKSVSTEWYPAAKLEATRLLWYVCQSFNII